MLYAIVGLAAAMLGAAPVQDTTVTVRGVIAVSGDSAAGSMHAVVVLAEPFVVAGRQIWVLSLTGDVAHWRDWDSRYVEATGSLGAETPSGRPFTPAHVRDVEPAGAATREVVSLSHHANVSLALVPRHYSATSSGVATNGITPLIFYKINVSGQTDIEIQLPTQELICFSVGSPGAREPVWRDAWRVSQKGSPFAIRIGPVFRVIMPVPAEIVSRPGDYEVQASVCGNPEYHVSTTLHVAAP
jgi:hypothetical protein